jgi:chromosomal replication initiation ATPase DnaA
MNTANKTERKFLQALIRSSKSLGYKVDHPWEAERAFRQRRLSMIQNSRIGKMNTLMKIVSAYYGQSVNDIRGHSRKRFLITPRHVFCHIAYITLGMQYAYIGAFLGGRDHSAIIHSVRNSVPVLEFNYPEVTKDIKEITDIYLRTVS